MKIIRPLLLLAISALVLAQSITLEEQTSFDMAYDHTSLLQTKIYTNGVLYRTYQTNEVKLISVGASNNVYAVTAPGFLKGVTASFTASVVSDGVESDQSNAVALSFKPRKPGNLRRF